MTTLVQFVPSQITPFTFQATFGDSQYTIVVTWNVFGERYYINVYDISGILIRCVALAATGPSYPASFSWANGTATAVTASNHNVPVGQLCQVNISQTNSPYDGNVVALATGPQTLTYPLAANPNQSQAISGSVNFSLNLIGGYIPDGWLVFHFDTQSFEF